MKGGVLGYGSQHPQAELGWLSQDPSGRSPVPLCEPYLYLKRTRARPRGCRNVAAALANAVSLSNRSYSG